MKKQQVFYLHGGESFADHNDFLERLRTRAIWDLPTKEKSHKWTDSLASDLGDAYEVFMPQMPNKQNAKYEEWKIWFERHFEYLHNGVILIGCSLGAMFLMKYLIENELPFQAKILYLMAGPVGLADFDDGDCHDFVSAPQDLAVIADRVPKVVIMHSKDDFLVPYEHALAIKEALPAAELVTFEDKNHFLVPELPELVAMLQRGE